MSENKTIFQAMAAVMRDIDPVAKDQQNRQQGFQYRGIEQVYNAAHYAMAKHGVLSVPHKILEARHSERQTAKGNTLYCVVLRMAYRFYGPDGSYIELEVEGEAMDSGDKGIIKAQSIAHRTALVQTFVVPYQGMIEPDAEQHEEPIPAETQAEIKACLEAAKKATNKQDVRDLWADAQRDGYLHFVSNDLKKMVSTLPEKKDADG